MHRAEGDVGAAHRPGAQLASAAPSTPSATPPATAFVLTQAGPVAYFLTAVALPSGRRLWSARIPDLTPETQCNSSVVAPRTGRAYVLCPGLQGSALIPVSLSTGAVGRPIRIAPASWSAALAPDGTTAYVANAGPGIFYLPGDIGSTITPVNLRTGRAGRAISVGDGPAGIAFAGDNTAYVSLAPAGQVAPVNLADGKAGRGIALPAARHGHTASTPDVVAVAPGARLLAVGNLVQDLAFPPPVVNLLNLASHRWLRPITLPGRSNFAKELAFSPDGRHIFVSAFAPSGASAALYIGSVATGRLTRVRFSSEVLVFALTPDGATLWVASETGSGTTALLPVSAADGAPGRAVAYLPGMPAVIGL